MEDERETLDLTPETPDETHPLVPEVVPYVDGALPAGDEPPKGDETPAPAEGELDCTGFKFNGAEATVEVPAELRAELASKGVDVNAVVKELYTSEDFTLTEATKVTLVTAFGKEIVESYLSALKAQNESTFAAAGNQQAAIEQAEQAAWAETVEQIGGEENWPALETFALATLDDAALAEFNKVMESGNRYAQKLAISDIYSKYKAVEGDPAANLIPGEVPATGGEGQALSYADFQKLIRSGEYRKNPTLYDALRRKGQAAGI